MDMYRTIKTANMTLYNHCDGLYRHVINGKTMFAGGVIEIYNGGFRKRLSDYRRESNSARKHILGRTINEYLDEITTYILVEGDTEEAVAETKWLEGQFIAYYGFSEWNSNSTFKIYRLSGGKGGWNEKRGV